MQLTGPRMNIFTIPQQLRTNPQHWTETPLPPQEILQFTARHPGLVAQ